MATVMKEDYGKAGIELDIQKVEWSAFTKRLREHAFDACTLAWAADARTDPTQIWHSKSAQGGSNYIGYSNPRGDTLIEDARVVFDADKRHAMYRELGKILHEEQPYTLLFVPSSLNLLSKRVRGAKETLAYWQFEDIWLAN